MREGALAGLVVMWVAVCGCGAAGRGFLAQRLDDAGDCVEASGGVGIPAYARARVTDYAVVGLGMAFSNRKGWCGRHGALDDADWATVLQVAIPLLGNSEINFFGPDVHGAWRVETKGPCLTERMYAPGRKPGPRAGSPSGSGSGCRPRWGCRFAST